MLKGRDRGGVSFGVIRMVMIWIIRIRIMVAPGEALIGALLVALNPLCTR